MVGLVDEWAARFFEELDYVNEGENGTLFAEMMKKDLPQANYITFEIYFFPQLICGQFTVMEFFRMLIIKRLGMALKETCD